MGQQQSLSLQPKSQESQESQESPFSESPFSRSPSINNIPSQRKRKTLEAIASENASKLKSKHDDLVKEIKEQQSIKKNNNIALKNMRELLDNLRASNNKLESELDQRVSTLETSQRRIWYTNKKEEKYAWFSNILTILLRFVLFCSIIYLLYEKKYISLVIILFIYLLIMHFL
jgi:Zn-dependent M32 family carboxypeptidase